MPRPKKGEKTPGSGRQKGTPNKVTQSLEEKCALMGVDVFEEMLKIATNEEHPDRFSCLKELAQYLYPKRKALEISNGEGDGFRVILCDYSSKELKKP